MAINPFLGGGKEFAEQRRAWDAAQRAQQAAQAEMAPADLQRQRLQDYRYTQPQATVDRAQRAVDAGNPFFNQRDVGGVGRGSVDMVAAQPILDTRAENQALIDQRLAHDPASGLWVEPDAFNYQQPETLEELIQWYEDSGRGNTLSYDQWAQGLAPGAYELNAGRAGYTNFVKDWYNNDAYGRNKLLYESGLGGRSGYPGYYASVDRGKVAPYAWQPDWGAYYRRQADPGAGFGGQGFSDGQTGGATGDPPGKGPGQKGGVSGGRL